MTEDANAIIILFTCGVVGLLYGLWNYIKVINFKYFIRIKRKRNKMFLNFDIFLFYFQQKVTIEFIYYPI